MPFDYDEYDDNRVITTLKSKFGVDLDRYRGFPTAPWAPPYRTDVPCARCGSDKDVWCTFADREGGIYYYCHLCLGCGHAATKSEYHGGPPYHTATYLSLPVGKCPFCGRTW